MSKLILLVGLTLAFPAMSQASFAERCTFEAKVVEKVFIPTLGVRASAPLNARANGVKIEITDVKAEPGSHTDCSRHKHQKQNLMVPNMKGFAALGSTIKLKYQHLNGLTRRGGAFTEEWSLVSP